MGCLTSNLRQQPAYGGGIRQKSGAVVPDKGGILDDWFGIESPQIPAPVDPASLINQQANANYVNQTTPFGNSVFTQGPDGRWNQNVTLTDTAQGQLNAQQSAGAMASGAGLHGLHSGLQGLQQPFDWNQVPGYERNAGKQPSALSYQTNLQHSINPAAPVQTQLGATRGKDFYSSVGKIPKDIGTVQKVSGNINYAGLPELNKDYGAQREQVISALNQRYNTALGDRYGEQERALQTQLANQGLSSGGEAYRNEMGDFNTSRDKAYQDAMTEAIMAGGNEQSRLFGMDLASRNQLSGERQFAADLGYRASAANAANQLQGQGLQLGAQNQAFNQAYSRDQSQFGQELARGQFANQAQGQQFNQNLAAGQFANQANLGQSAFNLGAQGQSFGQGLANAQLNNQVVPQIRDQALQQRYQPIQEAQSLFNFGQLQMPNVNNPQAPDVLGAHAIQQAALQNAYNNQNANYSANLSGLFGLGNSIFSLFGSGGGGGGVGQFVGGFGG